MSTKAKNYIMPRNRQTTQRIPHNWYRPAPFGKLKAISTFALLNTVVRSAEADNKNNLPIWQLRQSQEHEG